jgi:hypothetical protein
MENVHIGVVSEDGIAFVPDSTQEDQLPAGDGALEEEQTETPDIMDGVIGETIPRTVAGGQLIFLS